MQYKPDLLIEEDENGRVTIEAKPIEIVPNRPLFGIGMMICLPQLKANYWAVYGIEREDILQFQKSPLSYLENPYTKDFINPESIELPF